MKLSIDQDRIKQLGHTNTVASDINDTDIRNILHLVFSSPNISSILTSSKANAAIRTLKYLEVPVGLYKDTLHEIMLTLTLGTESVLIASLRLHDEYSLFRRNVSFVLTSCQYDNYSNHPDMILIPSDNFRCIIDYMHNILEYRYLHGGINGVQKINTDIPSKIDNQHLPPSSMVVSNDNTH